MGEHDHVKRRVNYYFKFLQKLKKTILQKFRKIGRRRRVESNLRAEADLQTGLVELATAWNDKIDPGFGLGRFSYS